MSPLCQCDDIFLQVGWGLRRYMKIMFSLHATPRRLVSMFWPTPLGFRACPALLTPVMLPDFLACRVVLRSPCIHLYMFSSEPWEVWQRSQNMALGTARRRPALPCPPSSSCLSPHSPSPAVVRSAGGKARFACGENQHKENRNSPSLTAREKACPIVESKPPQTTTVKCTAPGTMERMPY